MKKIINQQSQLKKALKAILKILIIFFMINLSFIMLFDYTFGAKIDRHISNNDLQTVNSVFSLNIQDKLNIVEYCHYKGSIDTTFWSVYIKNIDDYKIFLKDNSIQIVDTIQDENISQDYISCLSVYFKKSKYFNLDEFNPDVIIISNKNKKLYFFTEDDNSQSVIIQIL